MLNFGSHTGNSVPLHHSYILIHQWREEWEINVLPDQFCWELRKFLFLEKQTEPEKTRSFYGFHVLLTDA